MQIVLMELRNNLLHMIPNAAIDIDNFQIDV